MRPAERWSSKSIEMFLTPREANVTEGGCRDKSAAIHHDIVSKASSLHATGAATIPNQVPYLAAEPELVARWRERIGAGGFKVGICWQGKTSYALDIHRSFSLSVFAPLAEVPGVSLVSLQHGHGSEQLALTQFPVI